MEEAAEEEEEEKNKKKPYYCSAPLLPYNISRPPSVCHTGCLLPGLRWAVNGGGGGGGGEW